MSLATEKQEAKTAIKTMLEEMMTKEESSTDEFADRLVDIFEIWLKSAKIVYVNGLVAGANPVTGIFNGKLE